MTDPLRIAIVGYGTAGQACAALLARRGHALDVFERAPMLGPVGAGLLLQPTGMAVLHGLGVLDDAIRSGRIVRRLFGDTCAGRCVMDMRYSELDARLFGVGIQRGALFELLGRAWPGRAGVRCGTRVVAVDAERGLVRSATGEAFGPYDLVLVADGAASTLRGATGPARIDQPYPWGALWCLVPMGDWPHADELRQRYLAARKMIGLLPVGTRPDDPVPRLSFFWSLPMQSMAGWETDGIDAWKAELAALWPDVLPRLAQVTATTQLARASYRDAAPRAWHRGRVVLVGDAAHAMSPQLGQGVNMALMDAQALDAALAAHACVAQALGAYERERRAHVGIYHFWSRWLTPIFQSDLDTLAALRDRLFHPLGRLPGGRGTMLRVLSGTQRGWLGRLRLHEDLLATLARHADADARSATMPA
ncbi:FAD-dependent oxidoreductase [Chiayiivirga flava]|uniref:2-polyprenyl-6-methoxyphenol hydroxylase-like FAD-dependent oxidoreductase n=1 Tax=Chiayiivirga flava TaxID=659595 RepID=A0A7W8D396_9GAMM|nr:NAD(P)/FAD-dependent oxidoreductase [Chiayiivirga flava]MBB5206652.1 2-polyprenyl-6-methoxyphenol hydroxylase-like FAD-dependent oxidoreductase [Chiayiivirga flava]